MVCGRPAITNQVRACMSIYPDPDVILSNPRALGLPHLTWFSQLAFTYVFPAESNFRASEVSRGIAQVILGTNSLKCQPKMITLQVWMALGAGIPNWFKLLEELPTGVADRIGGV